jgi:hypothetical protein
MALSMSSCLIPAWILTDSHYIFWQGKVIQSGLMSILTDTTTSYLEINDASVAQIHEPSSESQLFGDFGDGEEIPNGDDGGRSRGG